MPLIVFLALILGIHSQASDFAKVSCPSPKILAQEILNAELHGWRNSFFGPQCLKQEDFKYFKVGRGQGYDEKSEAQPFLVDSPVHAKITDVKTEEGLGTRVSFTLTGVGGETRSDSFLFRVIPAKTRLHALLGCVHILAEPKNSFLLKSCAQ